MAIVNAEDGWNGYAKGDTVDVSDLPENDLAVLIKIGVLVPTTQKVEEIPSGYLSE